MKQIYQQKQRAAKILLLSMIAAASHSATLEKIGFDDWIISNSCSKDANILCQGYYKQYDFPSTNVASSARLPITITSDEASLVAKGSSVFSGRVMAKQGDRFLFADKASVLHNQETGDLETISAKGHVKIMQPGLRVDGTEAVAYVTQDRKVIDDAVYRIYGRRARGQSKLLTIYGSDKMQLKPASYTTCAPDSNAWYLKASETNFNNETGLGEAWHAKMYLKDVPVFYFPYVQFPIDDRRLTGFLQPDFDSSTLNGVTLVLPFYWNMAPNYDSTITSNYMSKRGMKFDTLWRYLLPGTSGNLKLDFLPHDRAYQALRNQQYADPSFMLSTDSDTALRRNDLKPRDFRYRYTWINSSSLARNLFLNIDYTDASDGNYFNDFSNGSWNYNNNQGSTIYALQRGSLLYTSMFGTLKYQLERYKTFYVVDGPIGQQQLSKLPEISYNSATWNLPKNFNFLVNAYYTSFRPRIVSDNTTALNFGKRFYMRPALTYSYVEPGWYFQPRAQLNYAQYADLHLTSTSIQQGVDPKSPHLLLPLFDIKTGLIFEQPLRIKQRDLFQTLEPQLYYLYVPVKNQNYLPNFDSGLFNFDYSQLFRDNRWAGLDRVSAANQITLGLVSRLLDADSGEELGMVGVGQIHYFKPNLVPVVETNNIDEHWSPIAVVTNLRIAPKYNMIGNWVRDSLSTKTASLQLQYLADSTHVINFGYEFVRSTEPDDLNGTTQSNLKQLNLSSAWHFTSKIRFLGKFTYDMFFMRETYILAGAEYHTCCTALRFVWSKVWQPDTNANRDYNYKVGIQFVFKGFAGIGNVQDQAIAALIPGYNANLTKL